MQTKNETPFPCAPFLTSRQPPAPELGFVVRGKFRLVEGGPAELIEPSAVGDPLAQGVLSGETFAEQDTSMTGQALTVSDLAEFKLHGEVLVRGHAHAPHGKPVTELPLRVALGAWSKTLRVTGDRRFTKTGAISRPDVFTKLPLDYERAFGGPGYVQNPVGKGFIGDELPNIEHTSSLVLQRGDQPPRPAGFGPLSSHWPQRASKRGKRYDATWAKTRAPFCSDDFDWTYFHAAPADQQLEGYVRGDESYEVVNLHPSVPVCRGTLPGIRVRIFIKDDRGDFRELTTKLDTVLFDSDEGALLLTWRGFTTVREHDLTDIQTVLVASEPLGEALPADEYKARLLAFEADPLGLEEHQELFDKRDRELAELASMQEAMAADEDPLQKLLTVAHPGTDEEKRDTLAALDQANEKRAEQGESDQVGAELKKAATKKGGGSPAPLVLLKPGDPLPPQPGVGAALDSALAEQEKARKAAQEQGADLESEGRIEQILNDPALAALRGGPAQEPGPNRDLRGQDYCDRDLRGCDFRGSNLTGALFTRADLADAKLDGANLEGAVFYQAKLDRTSFRETILTTANFTEASGEETVFDKAKLDKTFLDSASLSKASFVGVTAEFCVFQMARLPGSRWDLAKLFQVAFEQMALDGATFEKATLERCLMHACSVTGAAFRRSRLDKTSFAESDLQDASFQEARGEGTSFQQCKLHKADLARAVFPDAFFERASASGASFRGADLRRSRFYRAVLDRASFEQANLFRVDMRHATMHHTSFRKASLYGGALMRAAGTGVDFEGADLTRARIEERS